MARVVTTPEVREQMAKFARPAMAAREQGRFDEARLLYLQMWEAYPEPKFNRDNTLSMLNGIVGFLRDHGFVDDAWEIISAAVADGGYTNPNHAGHRILYGSVALHRGDVELAFRELNGALREFGPRQFSGASERYLKFAHDGSLEGLDLDVPAPAPAPAPAGVVELDVGLLERLDVLGDEGNRRLLDGDLEGGLRAWREGLALVPEPKDAYEAAGWFAGSLGDVLTDVGLMAGASELLVEAEEMLQLALRCPEGVANALVWLRLGQIRHAQGVGDRGREQLLRAFMAGGEDVFDEGDEVYLDVLRDAGDI